MKLTPWTKRMIIAGVIIVAMGIIWAIGSGGMTADDLVKIIKAFQGE